MTLFYFVRHGKTENNMAGIFNGGSVDSPLTKDGVIESRKMGEYLADNHFAAIYCSPIQRALTTAGLIVGPNYFSDVEDIIEDERFREMNLGDWDGTVVEEQADQPEFYNYFHHPDLFDGKAIHAETFQELIDRAKAGLDEIAEKYPNDKVLIVSHGLLLTFTMNSLLGVPLSDIRESGIIDNSSLTILESTECGPYRNVQWNLAFSKVAV